MPRSLRIVDIEGNVLDELSDGPEASLGSQAGGAGIVVVTGAALQGRLSAGDVDFVGEFGALREDPHGVRRDGDEATVDCCDECRAVAAFDGDDPAVREDPENGCVARQNADLAFEGARGNLRRFACPELPFDGNKFDVHLSH